MAIIPEQSNQQSMNPFLLGSLVQGGFNAITSFAQQRRANKFNVDMWNRQNVWNSPKEQMKRLQDAGLNPNLIYGSGAGGASGTATNAPQFEKLADSAYRPVDIPSTLQSFDAFVDRRVKLAHENKLETASELDRAKAITEAINQAGGVIRNSRDRIALSGAQRLLDLSIDAQEAQIQNILADTQYTKNQDTRSEVQLRQNVMESAQRILQSQSGIRLNDAQINKLFQDTRVQKFFGDLADKNIHPNLRPEIVELGGALAEIIKSIVNGVKGFKWPWE